MIITQADNEIADFFAGINPQKVIQFRPSKATQERLEFLLHKEKTTSLSGIEKSELDKFMALEHIMRLAKARAHQILKSAA